LDADKTNLTILLEPGEMLPGEFGGEPPEERPENLPLFGIEGKPRATEAWVVSGRVLDAETKVPLLRFRVIPGRRPVAASPWTEWQESRTVDGTNGSFALEFPRKIGFAVLRVEAEGYLPALSPMLDSNQTNCDLTLIKGVGPAGVLRLPNGQPAAGVDVVYAGPGDQIALASAGTIHANRLPRNSVVRTDLEGRFRFPPKLGDCEIVAANSAGIARVKAAGLAVNGDVRLEPWVTVRGRLVQNGKPVDAEPVDAGYATPYRPDRPMLHLPAGRTDAEGRFKIDHLPPGELQVSTRVMFGVSANSGWTIQPQRLFTAKPGETLDLGDIEKKAGNR
jgi:hypothetical protein